MIKKIMILIILIGAYPLFSQININPRKYTDKNGEFFIILPKNFKHMIGRERAEFSDKNTFLFMRRVDPVQKLLVFNDEERLLILKVYSNSGTIKEEDLRIHMETFEKLFNMRMKRYRRPYKIKLESFGVKNAGNQKAYLFYGEGDWYLKDSAFVQAVIKSPNKKTYIILGFVKKRDKAVLDNLFLNTIESFRSRTVIIKQDKKIFNLVEYKWFRYLIILGVAVAITILYNSYKKNKTLKSLASGYGEENKNSEKQ